MTLFSILATILIGPLKLFFEIVFNYANQLMGHPGLAIIYLSLVINILVLPLYRRADAMQAENRDREAKLQPGISHIKKTFTGDERMMILQAYYRQNHYKPTDALKGSISLLLEIPFFIAAYQFLSHLEILRGISLGPITDLGKPDGLLMIGGLTINLLPIIMTIINVISSAIYLKGFPVKTKIQLYATALFFLVFLYQAPSCLVFYWTLNNVFSLFKNLFYKSDRPQKVLPLIIYANVLIFLAYEAEIFYGDSYIKKILWTVTGFIIVLIPTLLKEKVRFREDESDIQNNHRIFSLEAIFLTIFIGLLIPSVFIAASPQEYVDITYFHHPLWYVVSSLCLAAGTFLVWMRVFYCLAEAKNKIIFSWIIWIMCGVMFVNYMFFGTNLGIISSSLQYENGMFFSWKQQMVNLLILVLVAGVLYFCFRKWKRGVMGVLVVSTIALGIMVLSNLIVIKKSVDEISMEKRSNQENPDTPHFQFSKTGNNVVVLMLDRAMGEYIPYIFNEKPELKEQFSGFTYYENTISFGGHTIFGSPALLGGYEYTPVEMNKRNTESLVSKHNEALKVMPVTFLENGYDVTVCDPVFANYQWIPDLSIYDEYPDMNVYITKGQFTDSNQKQANIENNRRNFFCFSMMKTMPLICQVVAYDNGRYQQAAPDSDHTIQSRDSMSLALGVDSEFMESYNVLNSLADMTNVTEDAKNTFLFLSNDMVHEPMLLDEPSYTPTDKIDNTTYDADHINRFIIDGRELKVENDNQMMSYQSNMSAMILLGSWFDYLRENDVYDNTRIILVADHGYYLAQSEELLLIGDSSDIHKDVELYYPLLMVKDFNSDGFLTSGEFMTNADVPTLAMEDLIQYPENPFTGKDINSDEKYAHEQFIILSKDWDIGANNGNTYSPARWATVKDNLWDKKNWTFYDEEIVLDEYTFPQ